MTGAELPASARPQCSSTVFDAARLTAALKAAGPPLLFGLRLWLSVCLALYIAFWLEFDNAYWAGTSAAIMCQPHLGASLRKGWYRLIGTVIGAVAVVVLTACFPQDRAPFLLGLALWGAGCALVATLLKNFAAYSAALAGYTVAIIASDQLGATGGPNGQAFVLAVYRASEICIGIVSAGVVLAGTDFGQARRRLATLFAAISSEITRRYAGTLAVAGANFDDTQEVRQEIVRRVIALDPVIDEAFGESSQLRYHSPVLQTAVKGLLAALASWRAVAVHLRSLTADRARQDADAVLEAIPEELRSAPDQGDPGSGSGVGLSRWIADPTGLRRICEAAVRRLISLPASVPSLRLLADQTAEVLAGISRALNGLALLIDDPARPVPWGSRVRLRVPDWLPSLVNAGRAFVVIGAAELFWIVTEWPNGAQAITFTAVGVILLAPRADQAYAAAKGFMVGTAFGVPAAAIIGFAVLPNFESFAAFSLALALVLVPVGAGMAQPWQTVVFMAMAANFVPLLAPANQQTYNTQQFYNAALAIVGGLGAAAFSFRLIPPLSPAYRTRRLLMLTVRDLRRLASNRIWRAPEAWEDHMYGRLLALPDEAQPLQRAQILAALSVATEIIQLRYITSRMDLGTELNAALEALGRGDVELATACLGRLDDALSARPDAAALRARGSILAMTEVLTQHAAYFEAGEPA
jgi:uncharacterized membrane protein YccC